MSDYTPLHEVISLEGLTYTRENFLREEDELLLPRMKEAGFSHILFTAGETDSFGPLTRTVTARKDGEIYYFVYG